MGMTIGISVTNGLEAVVISDTGLINSKGNEQDTFKKIAQFKGDGFSGTVTGAGMDNLPMAVLDMVRRME